MSMAMAMCDPQWITRRAADDDDNNNGDKPNITPAIIKRPNINIHIDISVYLQYFRDAATSLPTEEIDYMEISPLWTAPINAISLTVGSPLQLSKPDEYYVFISALYLEAKRCFMEDGNVREAKVLILTAGLFEQCRVSNVRFVLAFFSDFRLKEKKIAAMEQTVPYCHRAQMNTASEEAMRMYLDNLDVDKQKEELLGNEPIIQIQFKNLGDCAPQSISINMLTLINNLLEWYRRNDLKRDLFYDELKRISLKRQDGGIEVSDEAIRISMEHQDGTFAASFLPYAMNRTLADLEIKQGDIIRVEEVECCDSNIVGPNLLKSSNACFDPSLLWWLRMAYMTLHEITRKIPEDDHHQSLFQMVVRFWSEPGTGRLNFLSADTQMIGTFSNKGDGLTYTSNCYDMAKGHVMETKVGEYNKAKNYVLTAALMEQGQFTDLSELLELYSTCETVDEISMNENHPFLYRAFVATATRDSLQDYLDNLDMEAQKKEVSKSLCISVRFFHKQCKQYHKIEVSPLVRLETLLGIHINMSKFTYDSVRITTHEGRTICFKTSRRKTLFQLGIQDQTVFNVEDLEKQPNLVVEPPKEVSDGSSSFEKEFFERIMNLVKHYVKKAMKSMRSDFRQNLGEDLSIFAAIARYFAQTGKLKIISADELDKFDVSGNCLTEKLNQMTAEFMEGGSFFEAKAMTLCQAFIEQCQISGTYYVVHYFSSTKFLSLSPTVEEQLQKTLPVCYKRYAMVKDHEALRNHLYLQKFDVYQRRNELRGMEPRITLVFSNRCNGIDIATMTNVNSHMTFNHFVKKHVAEKHGKLLHQLRIAYNSSRVYLSSCGKKTLFQLGMKDDDILVFEDVRPQNKGSSTKKQAKVKGNPKKKNKGRAKQKNKPRERIIIPTTEEELRKEHSKSLSSVLDQLEREKLRHIRLKLNNLLIKKTSAKERKKKETNVDNGPAIINPPTDGLGGKAGKLVFPIIVGNSEHLYKSSKKSAKLQRHQTAPPIDLHGFTAGDAIKKLNKEVPILTELAMKEETFTICVDIICGGGNQILAEVVEQWIRKNRQVANRPKGLI